MNRGREVGLLNNCAYMKKTKIRADFLVIGGLILVGLVFALVLMLTKKPGKAVMIRVTGEKPCSISLEDEGRYEIQGLNGVNVLVIRDGKAHMEEASCPDGICMGMGEIDTAGQSIICLPNQIVVEVVDTTGKAFGSKDEIDVIAGGKQ